MTKDNTFMSQGPLDGETFQNKDADPIEEAPDETLADDPTDFSTNEEQSVDSEKVADEDRVVGRRNEALMTETLKPL